jgi:hypothetical protein
VGKIMEGHLLSCNTPQVKPMGWMVQGAIPDRENKYYYSRKGLDETWRSPKLLFI